MGKSFITKPKPKQDGSYWPCKKDPSHIPKVGQDIYMQNIGTDEAKNWIACYDLDCFILQGGTKPEANSGGYKKAKTPEETFSWRKALSDKAWEYAVSVAVNFVLDGTLDNTTRQQKRIDIAIAIYRGIMS